MSKCIFDQLSEKYDLRAAIDRTPCPTSVDRCMSLDVDRDGLYEEITKLMVERPFFSWGMADPTTIYALGLKYDPTDSKTPVRQLLGSLRYTFYSPYDPEGKTSKEDSIERMRGGYLDSYRYTDYVEEMEALPTLKALVDSLAFDVLRLSIRVADLRTASISNLKDAQWHVDGSPYEQLRLNIAVNTDGSVGIQYKDCPPIMYENGKMLNVIIDEAHRIFFSKNSDLQRINILVDISPWFKLVDGEWIPNEYFGKKHPYDIVKEGLLLK